MACKRTRELQKAIAPLGWVIVGIRNNGHYEIHNPSTGDTYSAPFSGSDRRGLLNLISQLKRINAGRRA